MAWIIHHLDILEQYCFQYSRHIIIRCANATKVDKLSKKRAQILSAVYFSKKFNKKSNKLTFTNDYKLGMA
jgi:hypothetical protein